ncbi:mucin-associated surface protein (MASP), putative, partial [Trypanosoma cruzi marinkellei]
MSATQQGVLASESSTEPHKSEEEEEEDNEEDGKVKGKGKGVKDTKSPEQKEARKTLTEESETSQLPLTSPQGGPSPTKTITTAGGTPAGPSNATPSKQQSPSPTLQAAPAPAPAAAASETNANTQKEKETPKSAETLSVQPIQEVNHGLETKSASGNEETIPTTVTKKDGPKGSNAESTPTSPSASNDAITNDADKSNDEKVPRHDQAPDGEEKNETQQDENKEENTNKAATVEAAAITNNTTM